MAINTNVNLSPPEHNADGLLRKYGRTESVQGRGGEFMVDSSTHVTEFNVGYADFALGTDATHNYILDYDVVLPAGAILEKCEFFTTTAWDSSGDGFIANFGLIKRSDFTIIDADGLMDSVTQSVMDLAGNLVVTQAAGSYPDITTYAGAELGTALSYDSLVTCFWETAAPTAGAGKLKIYWRYGV